MRRYKWFWMTFFAWCLLGTVGAWALIFSPLYLNSKKISEFTAQVNGSVTTSTILVDSAPISASLEVITKEWQKKGWKYVAGDLNLAPVILNIPKKHSKYLAPLVQLRVFQNKDSYRLLSLWNDLINHQTYQWITEAPQNVFKPQTPSTVVFPFKPPLEAANIVTVKSEKMETLLWTLPSQKDPETTFAHLYTSQGFCGQLWARQSCGKIYFLRKGPIKLLAIVKQKGMKNTTILVKLNKV
jgi:hypothetical protein